MSLLKTELKQPPWQNNAEGKTRRVGVELEMTGLDLDTLGNVRLSHSIRPHQTNEQFS
jgi:hypothetical protein